LSAQRSGSVENTEGTKRLDNFLGIPPTKYLVEV
jgi:hypothetical protein